MAAGLRIWDEDGNLIVDLTTRMGRVLGFIEIGTSNGSVTPPGADTGTLFAIAVTYQNGPVFLPDITITSSKISWDWGSTDSSARDPDCRIMYGVY